jgi:hypothetical protein
MDSPDEWNQSRHARSILVIGAVELLTHPLLLDAQLSRKPVSVSMAPNQKGQVPDRNRSPSGRIDALDGKIIAAATVKGTT